ncbi:MAG: hypothetical protein LBB10_01125 [Bifidobacteriaceae bacterium]|nr:hypothetical protein [Bifidobacteriaceae bacterium]
MKELTNNIECKISQLPVYELAMELNISYDFARLLKNEVDGISVLTCNNCILKCAFNKF